MSKDETNLTVSIHKDIVKKLKIKAIVEGKTIKNLVAEIITNNIEKENDDNGKNQKKNKIK